MVDVDRISVGRADPCEYALVYEQRFGARGDVWQLLRGCPHVRVRKHSIYLSIYLCWYMYTREDLSTTTKVLTSGLVSSYRTAYTDFEVGASPCTDGTSLVK